MHGYSILIVVLFHDLFTHFQRLPALASMKSIKVYTHMKLHMELIIERQTDKRDID